MLPLLLCCLTIQSGPLEPLRSQAHIDFVFGVGTIAEHFPYEAARVAFVEESDNICAVFERYISLVIKVEWVTSSRRVLLGSVLNLFRSIYSSFGASACLLQMNSILTFLVLLCVQMRMHCERVARR